MPRSRSEERLRAARAARDAELERRRFDLDESRRLDDELMRAERAYAAERGLEHAVDLDLGGWRVPVVQPVLLSLPSRAWCVVPTDALRDPPAEGAPGADSATTALCFERVGAVRIGLPNDELHHVHPLHGRGFDGSRPQEVLGSSWVEGARAFNAAHPRHRDDLWDGVRHFLVPFKDELFECQAAEVTVHWFAADVADTVAALVRGQ